MNSLLFFWLAGVVLAGCTIRLLVLGFMDIVMSVEQIWVLALNWVESRKLSHSVPYPVHAVY